MKIYHFVQTVSKNSGGLGNSIYDLTSELNNLGIDNIIINGEETTNEFDSRISPNKKVKLIKISANFSIKNLRYLINLIKKNFLKSPPNLIHLHGLWMPITVIGFLIAKIFKLPYVLSPHGMLMPYALKQSSFKKKLALKLYQNKIIKDSSIIFAASNYEYKSVKLINPVADIKIIPHGIKLPNIKVFKNNSICKNALFLGRLNPSKGIKELIKIWNEIDLKNWCLNIAGIIENNEYYESLLHLSKEKIKTKQIKFIGPVYGLEKEKIFSSSDLFISLTKSENFGISILEALAYKIPVLTTMDSPWELIEKESIGWWVPNNKKLIKKALIEASSLSKNELKKKGEISFSIARDFFSWNKLALKYIKEYQAILE